MNKQQQLAAIQLKSERIIVQLVEDYLRSTPEEREAIMAGIQFEREMVENCQVCRDRL